MWYIAVVQWRTSRITHPVRLRRNPMRPLPSNEDAELALIARVAFNAYGFECVIDRHGISAGEDWKRRRGSLISEADTVVFVLSPTSANSEICTGGGGEAAREPPRRREPTAAAAGAQLHFFYEGPKASHARPHSAPDASFTGGLGQSGKMSKMVNSAVVPEKHRGRPGRPARATLSRA